jgi:PIN domain nuclease of toxin-antitoxin system
LRLLLDAHTLIWAVDDPSRLGEAAAQALRDPGNDLFASAGTIWEISIKVGLGKLALSHAFRPWMVQALTDLGATLLAISVDHADTQADLPKHHGDPFDRLVIAQALFEKMTLVSNDPAFDAYGVSRIW